MKPGVEKDPILGCRGILLKRHVLIKKWYNRERDKIQLWERGHVKQNVKSNGKRSNLQSATIISETAHEKIGHSYCTKLSVNSAGTTGTTQFKTLTKCITLFCISVKCIVCPRVVYKMLLFIWLFVWIILTSLFSKCRPYGDRQKPANGTRCPTLTTDS